MYPSLGVPFSRPLSFSDDGIRLFSEFRFANLARLVAVDDQFIANLGAP